MSKGVIIFYWAAFIWGVTFTLFPLVCLLQRVGSPTLMLWCLAANLFCTVVNGYFSVKWRKPQQ